MESRIEKLKAFIAENPADPFLHYALASEWLKAGELHLAREKFEELVKDFPNYVGTYYHLGKLHEQLGNSDHAIATYESGLKIAQKIGDRHTFNEIRGALDLLID
jgi:tetratricopeptide (TPR) repeat protein